MTLSLSTKKTVVHSVRNTHLIWLCNACNNDINVTEGSSISGRSRVSRPYNNDNRKLDRPTETRPLLGLTVLNRSHPTRGTIQTRHPPMKKKRGRRGENQVNGHIREKNSITSQEKDLQGPTMSATQLTVHLAGHTMVQHLHASAMKILSRPPTLPRPACSGTDTIRDPPPSRRLRCPHHRRPSRSTSTPYTDCQG